MRLTLSSQQEKRMTLGDALYLLLITAVMALCFGVVDWRLGAPVALFILALLILVVLGKL
jgi:hypothetical protein